MDAMMFDVEKTLLPAKVKVIIFSIRVAWSRILVAALCLLPVRGFELDDYFTNYSNMGCDSSYKSGLLDLDECLLVCLSLDDCLGVVWKPTDTTQPCRVKKECHEQTYSGLYYHKRKSMDNTLDVHMIVDGSVPGMTMYKNMECDEGIASSKVMRNIDQEMCEMLALLWDWNGALWESDT